MKFVVKNVPPHSGGEKGEDLICSSTRDKKDRFKEFRHINDTCEEADCSQSHDSDRYIFQHRIFEIVSNTDEEPPQNIYMWVDTLVPYDQPKRIEFKGEQHCGYPMYQYCHTNLMSKR